MTACIHCRKRARGRGVYCVECHEAALRHMRTRPGQPHRHIPGCQRQKFDARTCACWSPSMHNVGRAAVSGGEQP